MRWLKVAALIMIGMVVGGGMAGYVTFRYTVDFVARFNSSVVHNNDLERISSGAHDLRALTKLADGDYGKVRDEIESHLTDDIVYLDLVCRDGEDVDGHARKILTRIHAYRTAHPWSTGDAEADGMVATALNTYAAPKPNSSP